MSKPKKAPAAQASVAGGTVTMPAVTIPSLMWSAQLLCGGQRVDYAAAEAACKALDLDGHTDWRLPTRAELLTLVDLSHYNPAIDTEKFPDAKPNFHWSSTPYAYNPADYAWGVYFNDGLTNIYLRGDVGFVRAVRSVAPAAPGQ